MRKTASPPYLPPNWREKPLIEKLALRALFNDVAESTIDRWIDEGVIPPGTRVGKRRLFWPTKTILEVLEKMNLDMKDAA